MKLALQSRPVNQNNPHTRRGLSQWILAALSIALAWGAGWCDSTRVWGAEDEGRVAEPFNGKDLTGWKPKGGAVDRSQWTVGTARLAPDDPSKLVINPEGHELINASGGGVDLFSEQAFGDCTIDIELMVPKGSNSGIYVMGEYEVQVLDSYGKTTVGPGDLGGLYNAAAPKVNASKPPGEWQRMVIEFQSPKFDAAGQKTSPARFVKVTLNGQVIHEDVTLPKPTPGGLTGKESATGPIMFQGDHGAVAYRNIKVTLATP